MAKVIVLEKPDKSVIVIHPVRPMRLAVIDPETDKVITPAETEKEYLDALRDEVLADPDHAGSVEVMRGDKAVVLPADRTDRYQWEYDSTANAIKKNPARPAPVIDAPA